MVALNVLAALTRLAGLGSRAAPAMESSAAALRAARMARASRGTDSMKEASQRFDLVGKPKFGDVVPAGPVTTPPGSAVAMRGSTMPAAPPAGIASPPPAGGALATRGSTMPTGGNAPDIYGKLGGAALTGAAGANVASQSPTSIFDFLPPRAEGDPAGAMNRRNDPMEPGYSGNAGRLISGAGLANQPEPGYGPPQMGDKESYGLSDAAYRQLADLANSAGKSDAEYRKEPPQRSAPARDVPLPTPRPSDGQSSAELMQQYNDSMKDDGGGQASLLALAERAQREGRASGGSAGKMSSGGGGKDAAIHKALEIIHHLLTRR